MVEIIIDNKLIKDDDDIYIINKNYWNKQRIIKKHHINPHEIPEEQENKCIYIIIIIIIIMIIIYIISFLFKNIEK